MAWLGTWKKRRLLTIAPAGKIDAAQSNIPVRINLSTSSGLTSVDISDIFSEVGSNILKIAVTTSDGTTECYVEIEKGDDVANDGEIYVRVPALSDVSDTVLYLYYDNTQPDNTSFVGLIGSTAGQAVWSNSYLAVYHMNQDPSSGSGAIKDSVSGPANGTSSGSMLTGDLVSGPIGQALDFDGVDDTINLGVPSKFDDLPTTNFTIEATINDRHPTGGDSRAIVFGCYRSEGNPPQAGWDLWTQRDGSGNARVHTDCVFTGGLVSSYTNYGDLAMVTNQNIAAAYDSTSKSFQLYIEGINKSSTVNSGSGSYVTDATQYDKHIGTFPHFGGNLFFDGVIDELRISSVTRSAAWLKATTHSNNDTLITFTASVETLGLLELNQSYSLDSFVLTLQELNQQYELFTYNLSLLELNQQYELFAPTGTYNLELNQLYVLNSAEYKRQELNQQYKLNSAAVEDIELTDVYYIMEIQE